MVQTLSCIVKNNEEIWVNNDIESDAVNTEEEIKGYIRKVLYVGDNNIMVFRKTKVELIKIEEGGCQVLKSINHKVSKGFDRKIMKNDKFVYHLDPKRHMIFRFDFNLKKENNTLHYENSKLQDKMMHIYPSDDDMYILVVLEDEKSTILLKNNEEELKDTDGKLKEN